MTIKHERETGSSPYLLDTNALQLPRRPGSMVALQRTVPAPANCEIALARVQGDIALDLSLESVMEGIWVSGEGRTTARGECARCLDAIDWPQEFHIEELFAYPATDARGHLTEDPQGDEDQRYVADDICDIEGVIRDAIVPDLPLAPLCSDDCRGLCPECGIRLDSEPDHAHETVDPRWAALDALRDREQ
jgi:uncharacterized protein